MLKKILSLVLIGVIALSLVACENENSKLQGKYYSDDGSTILDFDGKGTVIWSCPEIGSGFATKYNYAIKGNDIITTDVASLYNGEWEDSNYKTKETWKYTLIDDYTINLEYNLEYEPKNVTLSKNYSSGNTNIDEKSKSNSNNKVLTTKKEREEAIIGTWSAEHGKQSYIFNADGTCVYNSTMTGSLTTINGEWYIKGDKLYRVDRYNTLYANLTNWTGKSLQFIYTSEITGEESLDGTPYTKLY